MYLIMSLQKGHRTEWSDTMVSSDIQKLSGAMVLGSPL